MNYTVLTSCVKSRPYFCFYYCYRSRKKSYLAWKVWVQHDPRPRDTEEQKVQNDVLRRISVRCGLVHPQYNHSSPEATRSAINKPNDNFLGYVGSAWKRVLPDQCTIRRSDSSGRNARFCEDWVGGERERVYISSVKRLEHKGRIMLLPLLQCCRGREGERERGGWGGGGWEVDWTLLK